MLPLRSLVCAAALLTPAAAGAQAKIPPVHGELLSGEQVDLPEALHGHAGVLVVGFAKEASGEVTAWGKRLYDDFHASPQVSYYEVSILGGLPRLLRAYVLRKIKESVPATEQGRFLPVLDHESEWKETAAAHGTDHAYVLLVDGAGTVRGRISGAPTDALYAEMKAQLAKLGAN